MYTVQGPALLSRITQAEYSIRERAVPIYPVYVFSSINNAFPPHMTSGLPLYTVCVCIYRVIVREVTDPDCGVKRQFAVDQCYWSEQHLFHTHNNALVGVQKMVTFSISMHIMSVCYAMLVQRFEPQGRRFTNFHYCYY